MKKKSLYLLLILLLTFCFNINVKADTLECEYRINNKTLILAKKNDKKISYYYYESKEAINDLKLESNSNKWKKLGGKWEIGNGISNKATKCPAYVNAIKIGTKYALDFHDGSNKKCSTSNSDICNAVLISVPTSTENKTTCIYRIPKPTNRSVKIVLDHNANVARYYYAKNTTASKNSITMSLIPAKNCDGLILKEEKYYSSCPKYANVINSRLTFSDSEKKVDSNDEINGNININEGSNNGSNSGTTSGNNGTTQNSSSGSIGTSMLENDDATEITCEDIVGSGDGSLQELLQNGVLILRILIPIIVIALSTADIATAIFGEEDKMKKAQSKFITRLILAVAFFLAPSLLKLILTLANNIWPSISNDFCGIL